MTIQPMTIKQGEINIRLVEIPEKSRSSRKGSTMYDSDFDTLMEFKQAIQTTWDDFESIRRSASRYLANRGLKDKVSVRQRKDYKTKTYLMWFVNEPPVKRKSK